jgi:V/A-type H+-transporting ATPase subunit K
MSEVVSMNKKIIAIAAVLVSMTVAGLFAQASAPADTSSAPAVAAQSQNNAPAPAEAKAAPAQSSNAAKYIAAGLAVGIACIAGGMAVGKIGAAAMGAMSENAELSGKALPFVGLAEGICLWGFLVALLIIIL